MVNLKNRLYLIYLEYQKAGKRDTKSERLIEALHSGNSRTRQRAKSEAETYIQEHDRQR